MLPDKTRISDFYHLILDFWLKMVQYSPVDIRIHHQSAADHQQIMHIWILCQNVLSGNISFSRNQDQKQNEVNRCLFPITMIVSIDFRPFSEWKSENFQNVLSGNGSSGNHRMLLYTTITLVKWCWTWCKSYFSSTPMSYLVCKQFFCWCKPL